MDRIVIVGASLAGVRAAEALRDRGFGGEVTIVGAEARLPYDRPPLSKQILAGAWPPERTALGDAARYAALGLDFRLGEPATRLDLEGRRVHVGATSLPYDGLIVATGATPRLLPGTPPLDGIVTLRTLDDSLALARRLEEKPRVVVIGAGFIGMEVAATARGRGASVTMVEALKHPFETTLGPRMGTICAALHRRHGVELLCDTRVAGFAGEGRVEGVRLSCGATIPADVVVVGVGVTPNTSWLASSGLTLNDGVVCDATLATSAPGIYAAGDVARWHNPLFDERMRVEHWTNAAQQGEVAAANLLAGTGAAEPYAPVPYFWSDQYDVKIQFAGRTSDDLEIVHGSPDEGRFVALYRRGDRLWGVCAFNWPRLLVTYRGMIAQRASWGDAVARAASV